MKKYLFIGGLLATLAVAMVIGAQVWINGMQDDVKLVETVYFGDRAAAEGVRITTKTIKKGSLFWDADYTITSEGTDIKTEFSVESGRRPWQSSGKLLPQADCLSQITIFGSDEIAKLEKDGLMAKVYKDVSSRAEKGKEYREVIHLKNYTDYFPIRLGAFMEMGSSVYDANIPLFDEFQIPVPDDAVADVRINRRYGDSDDFEYSADGYLESYSQLSGGDFYTVLKKLNYIVDVIYHDDGSYEYTVNDYLPIPENLRGIFHVALGEPDERGNRYPAPGKTEMLYALPEGADPVGLRISPSGKELYLFTNEAHRTYLTIISKASGEVLQKLNLLPGMTESSLFGVIEIKNSVLFLFNNNQFALMSYEDGGRLKLEFTGNLYHEDCPQPSYSSYNIDYDYSPETGKLAIAALHEYEGACENLYIYENGDLKYMASYRPSIRREYEYLEEYYENPQRPLTVTLP